MNSLGKANFGLGSVICTFLESIKSCTVILNLDPKITKS